MITRWQEANLVSALRSRRAVHLTGVRQCGKSTLAGMVHLANSRRYTFDDESARATAIGDPYGFVARQIGETMVIDEVQKAPLILSAIKTKLDASNEKGQYLLTGSSNLRFAKAVKDSLAGRMRTIRLRTLTQSEIRGGNGDFLEKAFKCEFPDSASGFSKRDVIEMAFKGGYPEVLELDLAERSFWFNDYLDDLLMKDIRDVTEIRKLQVLHDISDWLMAHSSKFFEINELARLCGVKQETIKTYIEALKAIYLFDAVEPWVKSEYAKIGKRAKYFASDPSLVANILGWNVEDAYFDDDKSGKIIETWVYHELASLADRTPGVHIRQYRDSEKREIDFIVEDGSRQMLGIEVKAGSAVGIGDFKHLKWFANNLAKGQFIGIVLYSGERTLPFGKGFYAVPFGALAV